MRRKVRIRSFRGCSNTSDPVSSSVSGGAPASGASDSVIRRIVRYVCGARKSTWGPRDAEIRKQPALIRPRLRLLGQLQITGVQLFNLIAHTAHVTFVLDDIVRGLQARGSR